MRATHVALLLVGLVLGAASAQVLSEDADIVLVEPVPSRQLLQDSTEGSDGSGYGYGYYYGSSGHRRRLMAATEGDSSEGDYGYGYGYYGRRLSQEHIELDDEDQQQQQQSDAAPAAVVAAAVRSAHVASREVPVPVGKCYCQFDPDFNTFAIGETRCKDALYQKCKSALNPLECAWLDAYYNAGMKPGFLGHVLPHEADIQAFLFEDCTPAPPCACRGLRFDASDDEAAAIGCCRDLKTSCKATFSGINCKTVQEYCHDDAVGARAVAGWARHALRYADCSAYSGLLFEYMSLQDILAHHESAQAPATEQLLSNSDELLHLMHQGEERAAPVSAVAAGSQLLRSSLSSIASSVNSSDGMALLVVLGAGLIATALVAAAMAVAGHIRSRSQGSSEDGSSGPLLPPPSAAVAAMSRNASIMSSGSGMSEPLLPKRASRSNLIRGHASSNVLSGSGTPRTSSGNLPPSRNNSWTSLADSTQ